MSPISLTVQFLDPLTTVISSHCHTKPQKSEAFEEIRQVFLDRISYHMASLVQYGSYGDMNTTYTSTMLYHVIKFVSETYTLQEDTTCNRKIISAGEIFIKLQYLIISFKLC